MERQGRATETDAWKVSVSWNEGTVPCRMTAALELRGAGGTQGMERRYYYAIGVRRAHFLWCTACTLS